MFSRKVNSSSHIHGRQSIFALALVFALIGTGIGSLGDQTPATAPAASAPAESVAVPATPAESVAVPATLPADTKADKPVSDSHFESVKQGISGWCQTMRNKFVLNFIKDERWRYLTDGLVITIEVALSAVFFGACIGFFIAIVRTTHEKRHNLGLLNSICKIYLTVIRGTPMVVQLLIAYFVIFSQIREKIIVAIIAFSLNSGAYVAEVIRSGISSIDNGQMEAGRSLGLSYLQTLRYIVLPQAVRNVLPALGNEFITLLKDTSIAGYIALPDLTKGGDIIRSQTYDAFMPFLAVAAIYLSIVILFTWLLGKLEAKLNRNGAV